MMPLVVETARPSTRSLSRKVTISLGVIEANGAFARFPRCAKKAWRTVSIPTKRGSAYTPSLVG